MTPTARASSWRRRRDGSRPSTGGAGGGAGGGSPRAARHWRRVREGANPSGYPYTVAFRLLRRDRRVPVVPEPEPSAVDVEDEATGRHELVRALSKLPAPQRACV